MWGDSRRQWETSEDKGRQDPREGGHTIQHRHTCGETVGEDSGRRQWEKTVGEDSGRRQWGTRRQDPWEGGQTRHTYGETVGDKGIQGETRGDKTRGKADTPSNTGTYVGRQWETVGDKGRQGETRGYKGRQDPREGGHTIQHRHTCGETVGDKGRQGETRPSGRAHHPTQAHMWGDSTVGDSGRQGEEELCKMSAPPNRRRTETGTKRCQPHKPATPQREVAGNQAKQFKVHQQDEGD